MPSEFCQHGVRLLYPDNWILADDGNDPDNPGVSLESPDGPLVVIHWFRQHLPPEKLLNDMLAGLKSQYEDVETSPCTRQIAGVEASGREALFYCLDFLVLARCLVFDSPTHRIAVMCQAESRQFEKTAPVFDAILAELAKPDSLPAG